MSITDTNIKFYKHTVTGSKYAANGKNSQDKFRHTFKIKSLENFYRQQLTANSVLLR